MVEGRGGARCQRNSQGPERAARCCLCPSGSSLFQLSQLGAIEVLWSFFLGTEGEKTISFFVPSHLGPVWQVAKLELKIEIPVLPSTPNNGSRRLELEPGEPKFFLVSQVIVIINHIWGPLKSTHSTPPDIWAIIKNQPMLVALWYNATASE